MVTIEDLNSKKGTLLNGVQIRGQKRTLTDDENEVKLGMCPKVFRIRWHPVVLSFSFTAKELRADPWTRLRDDLEQLDIKYSAEYERETTHVISKKRNTSKGLQALINGKYIVTDSFINAVVGAATLPDDAEEGTPCALEDDFEGSWPNATEHLPPRGEEPSDRPAEAYDPDDRRQEVFDGYTFVFYERKQYENLFSAITAGKGKALLREVVPGQTDIDDFIRYVKGVAGEKGIGEFEDGSEGRGVVVVRYTPKGEGYDWFAQFLTSFAQRLDHRPIDQREFLEAILACDASMLRRPLEEAKPEPIPVDDETPVPASPQAGDKPAAGKKGAKGRKIKLEKEEDEILQLARRQREEAETLAAAKRRELEEIPDDGIDYAAIRALHIVEEFDVRPSGAGTRSREQDIEEGRWDPRWNGRRNFKRFRKKGKGAGRAQPRIILALEEVKNKEYGIGDDYWLEEERGGSGKRKDNQRESETRTTQQQAAWQGRADGTSTLQQQGQQTTPNTKPSRPAPSRRTVIALDSSDDETTQPTLLLSPSSTTTILRPRTRRRQLRPRNRTVPQQSSQGGGEGEFPAEVTGY
ncbi:hypothetical protein N0V88_006063 [Collariella sp. IMI 366227]|nr:hypothetical protein N0V88_006063 [Collariella sp. IMI 366227]